MTGVFVCIRVMYLCINVCIMYTVTTHINFFCFPIANSFVHLVRYIFSLPEVKEKRLSFLSNTLCQDPLEGFFGCQRQRGRESDNPSVQEFYQNTSALKVVNSFCRNSTTGNCRGANQEPPRSRVMTQQEVAPIPRRKRKRLNTD